MENLKRGQILIYYAVLAVISLLSLSLRVEGSQPQAPNILLIVADDLGYSDVVATLLSLAGVSTAAHQQQFPIQGQSLLPLLTGQPNADATKFPYWGWELSGNKAIRQGPWKLLSLTSPYGDERWHLYNLDRDPTERQDLASREPVTYKNLMSLWTRYARENQVKAF